MFLVPGYLLEEVYIGGLNLGEVHLTVLSEEPVDRFLISKFLLDFMDVDLVNYDAFGFMSLEC